MRLELTAPTTFACVDYWSGAATGAFTYVGGFVGAMNRARITVSFGIPEVMAGPVEAGTEYYAFQLVMNNQKTVGDAACTGCLYPTCIALGAMWLYQPAGLGDHLLCVPRAGHSNFVEWQGPILDCPPAHSPPGDCNAAPAVRRSWGLIKGLYR